MLIRSLKALKVLAHKYARQAKPGYTLCLKGDLGAGKTTFARYFIHYFEPNAIVTSPTFTLNRVYHNGLIVHYDLYRIVNENELFELDIQEDLYNKICIIEWPQRLGMLYPKNAIALDFKIIDESTREVTLSKDN